MATTQRKVARLASSAACLIAILTASRLTPQPDRKRHMFYLVYGIILVVLIAGCVMAAKYLHWINLVFLVLTFFAGIAASMGLAQVLYKRSIAVKKYNTAVEALAVSKAQLEEAIYGKPSDIGYGKNSLRAASTKLNLELLGRGRVWSGGTVTVDGGKAWNFKFESEVLEGEDAQLAQLKQIEVQVFRDKVINGRAYPVSYVGGFRITESTRAGFTLQPRLVVDVAEAGAPSSTWSVYEKMPLDRRGAFKQAIAATDADVSVDEMSIDQFRKVLETQFFPQERVPFGVDTDEYERLIDSYAFDGLSLGKIENWVNANKASRKSGGFAPRPEEVHVKYRFNKGSQEYTVDADGKLETDGPFTPLGHAVSRNLHLGRKVTFEEGDEVLIDKLTAEGYQRDGVTIAPFSNREDVTEIDRLYLRKYRDYPFMFSSLTTQAGKLNELLQERKADNVLHDNTIAKDLDGQIQERTRIQGDLEFDNENLKKDQQLIAGVEAEKAGSVAELQQKLDGLMEQELKLRRQVGRAAALISRKAEEGEVPVSTGSSSRSTVDFGTPIYSEPPQIFSQPLPINSQPQPIYIEGTPVRETPVQGVPVFEQPVIESPQPILQPRSVQPVPRSVPQDFSAAPESLNFSDQPRNAVGTRTVQPIEPAIEAPAGSFDLLNDAN